MVGRGALVAFVVVVLAAGCGDGGEDAGPTTAASTTASSAASTTAPEIELRRGTPLLEDDLTTPDKGGWPQTNDQLEVRQDRGGAALKAKTSSVTVWSPEVAAANATDVAVVADIRGISIALSFDDAWGVVCRREAGSFYSFALRGGGESGDRAGTKVFDWGIFKYEGGSAKRLAGGKADLGGSLFTVEADCYDDGAQADLRLLVNQAKVGRAVDPTPLTSSGTGIVFESKSGNSTLSVEKFGVHAIGPA
jgi:hypothetical protein